MRILWFTWKDISHPQAGGAETVNEQLAKRLVKDGDEVTFLVGGYKNCKNEEVVDGYKVIRLGNKFTVYLRACIYYLKHLKGWPDLIIEEINTVPFMTQWYSSEKRVLLIYQLCREIWFHQIFFPFNIIGYLVEPIYLWLLRKNKALTESESTKRDLQKYGFNKSNIEIFPIGLDIQPIADTRDIKKYSQFTILSLGSIRSMKRTGDQLKSFALAKKKIPGLQMKIAGEANDTYGQKVLRMIAHSPFKKDIEYLGKVTQEKKIELMQRSHIILVTSIKEGWGLIVTEAASQGTPAVVYNVDGLRDSVKNNETGLVASNNTPQFLAELIEKTAKDTRLYSKLQEGSLASSTVFTYERSYQQFRSKILTYGEK